MSYRSGAVVVLWILAAFLLMGSSLAVAQTSGLVAAYSFNETSGTTALDASGNNNTGTLGSSVTRTTAGKFGGALVFNGTTAQVTIPDSSSLRLTTAMTLEPWVYPTATPTGWRAVIDKNVDGYYLMASSSTNNRPAVGGTFAAGNQNTIGTAVLAVNTWTHLAATFDGATVRLYVNGVQVASKAQTTPLTPTTGTLQIGADSYAGENFAGRIDEVRVYNRALSQAEIQSDMTTPVSGTPPPNTPPTISAIGAQVTNEDTATSAIAFTVGDAETAAGSLTVSGSSSNTVLVPNGNMVFGGSGANRTVTVTPAANQNGTAQITVTVSDGQVSTATAFTVTVNAVNDAPTITAIANQTTTVGTVVGPLAFTVGDVETAAGSLTVSGSSSNTVLVPDGSIVLGGSGANRTVTLTPAGTQTGTTQITVTVSDGQVSTATSFTLTLNATPSGLMAAYAFDETSGTTALDTSGNGNNGVLTNGPLFVVGKNGNGVRLDGVNDYVDLGNPVSLRLTGSMTLSAWINSSTFPVDDAAIISKRQSSNTGYQLDTTIDTGPRTIGLKITDGAGNNVARYGTTAIAVNTWYHVAGVYDAANRTLNVYVNGQLVNGTLVGTIPAAQLDSNQNVNVGQRPGRAGNYNFAGVLDDVRIYHRALTQAEIQSDMATPVGDTPLPPDPIPPTVAINAPPSGATVFSLVSVSVAVSDNIGIAGVQFQLDGAPLGAEVTAAPYSVLWDTTSVSPGSNHILTAVARDFAGNPMTSAPVSVTVVAPTTSLVGEWSSAPVVWPIVAVHASLLPTGEVLAWDGQTDSNGHNAHLWNSTTGVFTGVPNNQTNMFCAGHCILADGKILVAGGHNGAHIGITDTNLFDPVARTWTKVAPMNYPRWYPTTTTLPNGRVLVTAGEINCNGCVAVIPEIYNPQTNVWTQLSGASLDLPDYPHMFVLPDGRVLAAAAAQDIIITYVLDVSTQTWSIVDPNPVDGGSSAMYLPGKVIKSGTSTDTDSVFPSAATTYVLDMTQPSPAWQETAPMAFTRTFHNLTLLPDGTVLATGGGTTTDVIGVSGAVHNAELWSPVTATWTTMASMQKPRLYHSTALLLPDGRVLVMGGGRWHEVSVNEPTDQLSSETYSPPYLFKGPRPTISAPLPTTATYGGTITVQTPNAARIAAVSLIRLGSVTHAFDENQRFLQLSFATVSGALNVQAPANANLAPPGHYMLFILDTNGVPSVAAILRLQ